jgi:hypothetical protein
MLSLRVSFGVPSAAVRAIVLYVLLRSVEVITFPTLPATLWEWVVAHIREVWLVGALCWYGAVRLPLCRANVKLHRIKQTWLLGLIPIRQIEILSSFPGEGEDAYAVVHLKTSGRLVATIPADQLGTLPVGLVRTGHQEYVLRCARLSRGAILCALCVLAVYSALAALVLDADVILWEPHRVFLLFILSLIAATFLALLGRRRIIVEPTKVTLVSLTRRRAVPATSICSIHCDRDLEIILTSGEMIPVASRRRRASPLFDIADDQALVPLTAAMRALANGRPSDGTRPDLG